MEYIPVHKQTQYPSISTIHNLWITIKYDRLTIYLWSQVTRIPDAPPVPASHLHGASTHRHAIALRVAAWRHTLSFTSWTRGASNIWCFCYSTMLHWWCMVMVSDGWFCYIWFMMFGDGSWPNGLLDRHLRSIIMMVIHCPFCFTFNNGQRRLFSWSWFMAV